MKIIVINGPNINMLGKRERDIYGTQSYKELVAYIEEVCRSLNIECDVFQHNSEGDIITSVQNADDGYDAIIINPAAYTHYSIAIYDALKSVNIPAIEVHLTDIYNRENFRKISVTGEACLKIISGKGFEGYKEAIIDMMGHLRK